MDGAMPSAAGLLELLTAAKSPLDARLGGWADRRGARRAAGDRRERWHRLVADPTPPDLAAALDARKAALAAAHHDGLEPDDLARRSRAERLRLLRDRLAADGFAGFIVPRADEHQGEYVPLCGQRLAWLTGFTGSAGMAIVLKDRAAIFVDGRYTLQAGAQVDTGVYEIRHLIDEPAGELASRPRQRRAMRSATTRGCTHAAGRRAAARRGRARRRDAAPGRGQPARRGLARPSPLGRWRRFSPSPTASPVKAPPTSAPASAARALPRTALSAPC